MRYIVILGVLIVSANIWQEYIKMFAGQSERDIALRQASHGAAMLVGSCFAIYYFGPHLVIGRLQSTWDDAPFWYAVPIPVFAVWGLLWTISGCGWRSRGLRDSKVISRCVLKIGLGIAILCYRAPEWATFYLRCGAAWCLVTALVKLVLVLRGLPKVTTGSPEMPKDIRGHGRATIAKFVDDEP